MVARMRFAKAIVGVLVVVLAVGAEAAEGGLHVLLTNDDGFDAAGIVTLKVALRGAGHRVTVVAPASNRSGASASLTFGELKLEEVAPGEYKIDATPATCVLFAALELGDEERPFDLLMSGTNRGANAGLATNISGTVGATTVGSSGFVGLPAIALSTNPIVQDANDPAYAPHFAQVAEFAVRLVALLQEQRKDGAPLLPPGVRLNVNYPARNAADVKGVRVGVQGRRTALALGYEQTQAGTYRPQLVSAPAEGSDVDDSDATLLAEGYITIVPLGTDYTAPADVVKATRKRLKDLEVR
jgi:5'-nucleotidase